MIAEVPETLAPACELFSASGYVQEALLTDYVLQPGNDLREADHDGRFVIPVTVDDLAANGLLGEADPQVCWERSVETLTARKDDIAGLAVASDERIEAYLLYVKRDVGPEGNAQAVRGERPDRGDCVAPLCYRGRWSTFEAIALSTERARHEGVPVPEGPPVGDLRGVPGDARFPPRRRASTLRSEGAVRLVACFAAPGPARRLQRRVRRHSDHALVSAAAPANGLVRAGGTVHTDDDFRRDVKVSHPSSPFSAGHVDFADDTE